MVAQTHEREWWEIQILRAGGGGGHTAAMEAVGATIIKWWQAGGGRRQRQKANKFNTSFKSRNLSIVL